MSDSILVVLSNSWKGWLGRKEKPFKTLAAFVMDAEHELLSVITALQAHIDLLYDELILKGMPVDRFTILNRAISRLIRDTTILGDISVLARLPKSKQKLLLETLMKEITEETRLAFQTSQVDLSCNVAAGTTVTGEAAPLKAMVAGLVLSVLYKCNELDTVRVKGLKFKNRVTLSVDSGPERDTRADVFKLWEPGELRNIPLNGEGMSLSAVNAIARLHDAELSVSTVLDEGQAYKLIFKA